ncbi:MAG TPA: YebC/PmpR family DNA-binding transcriptional regulator [Firmicutes bacterium]|nr:YebC/PmpR family DNA-binding transcriptional regulator [Bacillota bacterium]HHY98160.1 YebC/PmpR family DNA-binding transcriptional regulator [Bacillota bacterium]
MSGHSKWANIKHKKAKADAEKGKIFTKVAREIIVAARQGGGDPEANFKLRMAIEKARSVNMSNDSIMRAIKRGAGASGEDQNYEQLSYEGYGPGGVAIMLDVLTDNKNRSASDIRHIFARHGGNLGESGCVAWLFDRVGVISIDLASSGKTEDELMAHAIEAGALDLKVEDGIAEITTQPDDLNEVCEYLKRNGIPFDKAEITMVPKTTVRTTGKEAQQVLALVEDLEDHDDVSKVYANFDIPDEEMEQLAGA